MDVHTRAGTGHRGAALLERKAERARLSELIAATAVDGHGSLAAVVGGAGEGKTALLNEAAALGANAGLGVWEAYGSMLERPLAFGVVRQLLQPVVMEIDTPQRARVLAGPARLAASVLDLAGSEQPLPELAAQHGLYWLLSTLADRAPLMLLVDDAHWADEPSLAWLASLMRRIARLPVLVVVATRPPAFDGAGDALAALLSDRDVPLLDVRALGEASIATLTRRELDAEPDQCFIRACHHATAGNPLAVIELLRDLRREGSVPDATRSQRLGERAPEAIDRHVRGRLERLGGAAVQTARALAVLGDRAPLRQVAALAGVDQARAGGLIDELVLAGIVAQAVDLRFAHPLVHAAVRDSMTPRQRAGLHGRAAALLAEEQRDPEAIAAHLLVAEPAGDPVAVTSLRAAAAAALRRGSPDSALAYLKRALVEPPAPGLRGAVLGELGGAVWMALDTTAIDHLQAARELAVDSAERGRLALMLAEVCFYGGQRDRLFAVLELALEDLGGEDPALAHELRAMRTTALTGLDAGWPAAQDAEHERLVELVGAGSELGRELRLDLALVGIWTGRRGAPETIAIVEDVLDEAMLQRRDAGSVSRVAHGLFALLWCDAADRAAELAQRMMTRAAEHGIAVQFGLASHVHAQAQLLRGALADAEASARMSLKIAVDTQSHFAEPLTRATLGAVLIERGRLEEAARLLTAAPADTCALAIDYFVRPVTVKLHRARGARDAAIAELAALRARVRPGEDPSPLFMPWRSDLAFVIAAEDPQQAAELAESELRTARRLVLPRAVGVALRARATTERGTVKEATLRESVAVLEDSPARLELTRSLIDLGAHLRRTGRRGAARGSLRRALELAHRCAAEPLIALAGDELRAADGRPRSPWLTGAAALTPSELRVARLAASGLSNQRIAETLFVTVKTVEMHLTRTYRKLGTRSRAELPRLLEGDLDSL